MAERKSARTINARKKALEAAKAFQERENRLLLLAEDYFKIFENNGSAAIEKKIEDYQTKIEELQEELVQIEKDSERDQAVVIARFKEEGVTNTEIASRLELSPAEVRSFMKSRTADSISHEEETISESTSEVS